MPSSDYYETLGVSRDASIKEIKSAYKGLVRKFHPDVAEDKAEAEKQMSRINEAYKVLSDDESRAYYDRFGQAPNENHNNGDFGGMGGFGFPFGDLFESMFDQGQRGRGNRPTRGDDVRVDVTLTLEEAFTGKKCDVEYFVEETCLNCQGKGSADPNGSETCKTCGGAGQVQHQINIGIGSITQVGPCPKCGGKGKKITKPCKECRGTGIVNGKKKVAVTIPAGIGSNVALRVPGKGQQGTNGGPCGNLIVVVNVEEDPRFTREGADLILQKRITFTQAALGDTIPVELVVGEPAKIVIPAGTQNGAAFRLPGKGMPNLGRSGSGDLHVVVEVMVPTNLNAKQKSLLKEFAEAGSQEAQKSNSVLGRIRDAIFG